MEVISCVGGSCVRSNWVKGADVTMIVSCGVLLGGDCAAQFLCSPPHSTPTPVVPLKVMGWGGVTVTLLTTKVCCKSGRVRESASHLCPFPCPHPICAWQDNLLH